MFNSLISRIKVSEVLVALLVSAVGGEVRQQGGVRGVWLVVGGRGPGYQQGLVLVVLVALFAGRSLLGPR